MSPNHRRRASVLAEYMPCSLDCAQYSEWENRSKSWLSWDIRGKQITLSLHHSHSYAEESPLIGLSNCYGEVSHLFYTWQYDLQQHNRRETYVFCLLCSDRSHFLSPPSALKIQYCSWKGGSFPSTLALSQTLFLRPWFSWYQLNTLHVSLHWSMGWN